MKKAVKPVSPKRFCLIVSGVASQPFEVQAETLEMLLRTLINAIQNARADSDTLFESMRREAAQFFLSCTKGN